MNTWSIITFFVYVLYIFIIIFSILAQYLYISYEKEIGYLYSIPDLLICAARLTKVYSFTSPRYSICLHLLFYNHNKSIFKYRYSVWRKRVGE